MRRLDAKPATRGDDAVGFDYLERGAEVWRVRVRKERDVPPTDPFA